MVKVDEVKYFSKDDAFHDELKQDLGWDRSVFYDFHIRFPGTTLLCYTRGGGGPCSFK